MFAAPARVLADALAPSLARWSEARERTVLAHGRPLDPALLGYAGQLGIREARHVRVELVRQVPLPLPSPAVDLALKLGLPVFRPAGMALGHAICALSPDPALLRHELVHVLQFQRLGGHLAFMRRYLFECLRTGYHEAPLEREARERSRAC